jgi:hypothetical protein
MRNLHRSQYSQSPFRHLHHNVEKIVPFPMDVQRNAWGHMDTNPTIGYLQVLDRWIRGWAWSDVQQGLDSPIRGRKR